MQKLVDLAIILVAVLMLSVAELVIYSIVGYVLVTSYIEQDWPVFVTGIAAALVISSSTLLFFIKTRRESLS